jgi:hypothetical protein
VVDVTLKVNGQAIVTYTMGDNPDAGEFFILRVPMDSLDPAEPGRARSGDKADIFVNDETQPIASITLGERGGIRRLDFEFSDDDYDGLPDGWEQQIVFGDPHDSITDIEEVDPRDDFDMDRFSNLREYLAGSDPVYASDIPVCWSDVYLDGDVDGKDAAIIAEEFYYNEYPATFDLDGDGDLDEWDMMFFCEDFGRLDCNE